MPSTLGLRQVLARAIGGLSRFFSAEAAPGLTLDALQRENDRIRLQSRHWLA